MDMHMVMKSLCDFATDFVTQVPQFTFIHEYNHRAEIRHFFTLVF